MWYTVYVNPQHLSIICSTESVSGFELFPFEINHLGHLSYHLIFNLTTRNGKNNKITSEKRVPFIELAIALKNGIHNFYPTFNHYVDNLNTIIFMQQQLTNVRQVKEVIKKKQIPFIFPYLINFLHMSITSHLKVVNGNGHF